MSEQDSARQLLSFQFFHVGAGWRRLTKVERDHGKREFQQVMERFSTRDRDRVLVVPYSTIGVRAEADFMLWRIASRLEPLQHMSARLLETGLGTWLSVAHSFLSMTKRSWYIDNREKEGHTERTGLMTGSAKYLFLYPLVREPGWYRLPLAERQRVMDEQMGIIYQYPTVRLNTTYSFGLDDQEYIVALETDRPDDALDLVQALRGSESFEHVAKVGPVFTCVRRETAELLELLGG